jgi:hypothetical protein
MYKHIDQLLVIGCIILINNKSIYLSTRKVKIYNLMTLDGAHYENEQWDRYERFNLKKKNRLKQPEDTPGRQGARKSHRF